MKLEFFKIIDSVKDVGQLKIFDELCQMNLFVTQDLAGSNSLMDKSNEPLDLPFSHCFFEALSIYKPGSPSEFEKELMQLEYISKDFLKSSTFIGVVERDFNNYTFYVVLRIHGVYDVKWINDDSNDYIPLKNYVRGLLEKIKKEANSTVDLKRIKTLKIGRKNKKKIYQLKPVIYCSPKKETKKFNKIYGRELDWSHSWEVRGHWRKVQGLGKDRKGEYCIKGYTWINPFIKGKGDLVKKIRILNE